MFQTIVIFSKKKLDLQGEKLKKLLKIRNFHKSGITNDFEPFFTRLIKIFLKNNISFEHLNSLLRIFSA